MSVPAYPTTGPDHGDRSSLHRFLAALNAANVWHRVRGDHVDFRCPLPDHPDRDASGTADWRPPNGSRAGKVLFECHACGPAANGAVIEALGLRWPDLFDDPPARQQSSRSSRSRSVATSRRSASTKSAAGDAGKGDKAAAPRSKGRLVATYVYRNESGELVGECRRYEGEIDPEKGKARKTFSWRRPNAHGAWDYRMPSDCPLYRLPDLAAARSAAGDDPVTVWLVEGEKNADDLAAAGVVAVSAPNGAHFGWKDAYTEVLAGAHVILVVDRDEQGLKRAESVGQALAGATASLRAVRTPVERRGADASDHLAAGLGLDEFEPVSIAAAHGAVPAEHDVQGRGEDRAGELLVFPGRPGGEDVGRDELGGGGSGGGDSDEPIRRRMVRERYDQVDDDGGAVVEVKRVQVTGKGEAEELLIELLDARVRIVRRLAVDPGDGTPVGTTHLDLIASRGEDTVKLDRVPWDDFRKGAYVSRLPWPVTWKDTPSGRSKLANAITKTSGPVPVVTAYGTLGWREIGGQWVYVHAAGGISAAGAVPGIEVEISPRLRTFTMPDPPSDAEEFAAALRGVLAVLEQLPARIAAPVMAAPFRALLGAPGMSVFPVGHTGSRKSGMAALAQQVHCPAARHKKLPVGAGEAAATLTAMEELLWQAGDALLVADDSAPDRGAERAATRMNELLRMVGNEQSKARGARAGGLREDRPPRALLMLTGEDGASRPSAESRTVYVPMAPGDVPLEVIKALSARELIRGRNITGAAVARYLAGRMPVEEWIEDTREGYVAALLEATGAGADPDGLASRRADSIAELALGWRALLDAALAAGALDAAAAEAVWARAWGGLVECLAAQVDEVERRGLVERAADLLRSALRSGRAHLENEHGGAPSQDRQRVCGWRREEGQFGDIRPGGDAVGWASEDRRHVWLDPGAAFAVIERQGRSESDPLGVTARALVKALLAAKTLSTEEVKGRPRPVPQVRRHAAGARQRVWELPWSWLWPDDAPDAPDPSDDGGSGDVPPPSPDLDPTPPAPLPVGNSPAPPEKPAETRSGPSSQPPVADTAAARSAAGRRPLRAVQASAERYRAAGVVVDIGEAKLIGGGPVEVPEGLNSLPAIAEWAHSLSLGVQHARSRNDAGQVWIMPALARACGLGKPPVKGSKRATTSHPAVKALTGAGWEVGNRGVQAWTHVWRPSEAGMHLVVVPWLPEKAMCDPADPPSVHDLAERLDVYASLVGTPSGERQPFLYSAASTGTALLKLIRGGARDALTVIELPPPATEGGGRLWEPEWSWQRGPTDEERRRPFVVAWDVNAQYLAAAALAELGLGPARHIDGPTMSGSPRSLPPGYWRLPRPAHDPASLLPDLFNPAPDPKPRAAERAGEIWVTTPTLVAAYERGYDLSPSEAWVWDEHTRWLGGWAEALRDARYALDRAGADNDPELKIVSTAVKLTYAGGIGMLGSEKWRTGKPEFRPDARQHVIALAKANLYRKCAKAATAGWAPLAIERDTVLFASESDNPNQEPPPGFRRSKPGEIKRLGEVKWLTGQNAIPMNRIADALATSPRPSSDTFGHFGEE